MGTALCARGRGGAVGGAERRGGGGAQVVRGGAYRCVCLELEVQHLAVAAITALEELAVLEGGESGGAGAGPPALPVLARLVAAWLQDASQRGSRWALPAPPPTLSVCSLQAPPLGTSFG